MNFPGINLNSPEECQTALELNERFIHRYTELLDRFGNLPACDALIYEQLKGEFPAEFLESLPSFTFLPPPGDPTAPNANAAEQVSCSNSMFSDSEWARAIGTRTHVHESISSG